jgi:hypothetical protein
MAFLTKVASRGIGEKGEGISQFLDQLINVNQVGNFVVYGGGTIELVGKPESVYFCTAPQVVAKVCVEKKKLRSAPKDRIYMPVPGNFFCMDLGNSHFI